MPDKSDGRQKPLVLSREKEKVSAVKVESTKRKASEFGSQNEKKPKIERKGEPSRERKDVAKTAKKPVPVKSSIILSKDKESAKKPENRKKAAKPKDAHFPDFDEDQLIKKNENINEISQTFSETTREIKKTMKDLIEMKREKNDDKDKFHQLRTSGCLKIAILKRLNRFSQVAAREYRDQTKEQLAKSDQHFLKLQNLQYQAHHLQNEIKTCLGFRSAHKDLELEHVDAFYLEGPEELLTEAGFDDTNEHQITCARLKWENQKRLTLQKSLHEKLEVKENLDELSQRKLTNLNNVRPQLQNVLQAANGVRGKLRLGGVVGKIGEAVSFLTNPLAAIYKAGVAYRQSNGTIDVAIEGDEKAAMDMKERGHEEDDAERNESTEGDDVGRRTRKKKRSLKGCFPVWIEWRINNKVIQFKQSTINKAIYAESCTDFNSPELSCLYEDDCGLSESSFGRNYWWAAQLSNQEDLPEGQNLADFVSDLVERLKMRFINIILSEAHIKSLQNKDLPVPVCDNMLITGTFISFEPCEDFSCLRRISHYSDGKLFKITVEQKSGKKVSAKISISPNYPIHHSLFVIIDQDENSCNSAQIQYLEELVNLRIPLQLTDKTQVLSHQIAALMSQSYSLKISTRNRINPIRML